MSDVNEQTVEQVAAQLREQRALIDVQRRDKRERLRLDADHRESLAEMAEQAVSRKRARRERDRDEAEAVELSALYRRASRSGARARIRADINRSAEMRALRVAWVRKATLWIGLPVLVAFGAWSTAGVQVGVVKLFGLAEESAGALAAWAVEPALLTIVAAIIVGRAVLRSSGGDTDRRATLVEVLALGTSVALNMAGGWTGSGLEAIGGVIAHSVGPLGAAGTAWLIGLFDSYVAKADPWKGAPRLADLDLAGPAQSDRAPATKVAAHVPAQEDEMPAQPGRAPVAQADRASELEPPRMPARVELPQVAQAPARRGQVVLRTPKEPVAEPSADEREESMLRAIARVRGGEEKRSAARAEGVSESTLRDRLKKTNGHSFEPVAN
ncbi:hypothetical protein ABZ814_13610 [Micromonospora musae]|uniref:hypothetical protein n=1 Tax=Micromonospora musae TaxID=1894970 RepID=UPI0033E26D99